MSRKMPIFSFLSKINKFKYFYLKLNYPCYVEIDTRLQPKGTCHFVRVCGNDTEILCNMPSNKRLQISIWNNIINYNFSPLVAKTIYTPITITPNPKYKI